MRTQYVRAKLESMIVKLASYMFDSILWSQSHECALSFSIPVVKSINCSKLKTVLGFYICHIH